VGVERRNENLIGALFTVLHGEIEMIQSTVFVVVLIVLALAADIVPAAAQSAYSYPWCLVGVKSGHFSCYFNDYQQCMTSKSGLGGHCARSPYYRGPDRL
jgi:hypothetical protein